MQGLAFGCAMAFIAVGFYCSLQASMNQTTSTDEKPTRLLTAFSGRDRFTPAGRRYRNLAFLSVLLGAVFLVVWLVMAEA
jgi:hypothetical protein